MRQDDEYSKVVLNTRPSGIQGLKEMERTSNTRKIFWTPGPLVIQGLVELEEREKVQAARCPCLRLVWTGDMACSLARGIGMLSWRFGNEGQDDPRMIPMIEDLVLRLGCGKGVQMTLIFVP